MTRTPLGVENKPSKGTRRRQNKGAVFRQATMESGRATHINMKWFRPISLKRIKKYSEAFF
jgi:hypothetical protein